MGISHQHMCRHLRVRNILYLKSVSNCNQHLTDNMDGDQLSVVVRSRWCRLVVQVTDASTLELVKGSAPTVKLDDKHYKLVDKVTTCLQSLPAPLASGAMLTSALSRSAEPQITLPIVILPRCPGLFAFFFGAVLILSVRLG